VKVSVLQSVLSDGLGITGRAVSTRTVLPVLGNVLLEAKNGRLRLSATDLEIGINCWIDAKVDAEGAITVPARTLTDLVSAFPPKVVEMELVERTQTLNLCAGRTEANVKGIAAEEFPIVPVPDGESCTSIEAEAMREVIQQVAFAAATDESRPVLTGVYVRFGADEMTMAAADGYRLSVRTAELSQPVRDPFSFILPARALIELRRVTAGQEAPISVTMRKRNNQVLFGTLDVVLVSQLIDGNFPDYAQIIPKTRVTRTVVDTSALMKAFKTASVFARYAGGIVRVEIVPRSDLSAGRLIISARSSETGDNVMEIDADVEGEALEIAFNAQYAIDALSAVGTDRAQLDTTVSSAPALLRPVDGGDFTHVIMPMHLGRK